MTPGEEGEIPVSPPHLWPRIHVLAKAGFCPRGRPVRISIHQCAEQAGRGSLLPGKVDSELLERGGVGRAPQMNIFLRTSSRARPWSREAAPKEETTPAPQAQSQHPRAGNPTCSARTASGPPWLFFDLQGAEGEATHARAVGISGATVPPSGSFLSAAWSFRCLVGRARKACDGRKPGPGALSTSRGGPGRRGHTSRRGGEATTRHSLGGRWAEPAQASPTQEPRAGCQACPAPPGCGGVAPAATLLGGKELRLLRQGIWPVGSLGSQGPRGPRGHPGNWRPSCQGAAFGRQAGARPESVCC